MSILVILTLIQLFVLRYGMKSNLWLENTTKIIIQENISGENKKYIINDENYIDKFKSYFDDTKISYVPGAAYVRYYKITFVSDSLVKSYGYTRGNYVTNFGKGPGSLSLLLRIYETDPSFESFMETIIKDGDLEYEQFKKVSRSKTSLWNLWVASPKKSGRL
jgi:hypothetical protein